MRYVIGDSARLVTPYRGYSWVTIIGYEGDGYCVELTSGLEIVVREDELEDHPEVQKGLARQDPFDEGSLSDDTYVSL